MAGVFDTIAGALAGKPTGVSGIDTAMSAHADKLHPVGGGVAQSNPGKTSTNSLRKRPDGSLILPNDGDYKP